VDNSWASGELGVVGNQARRAKDNSPAIYRWVIGARDTVSPAGTKGPPRLGTGFLSPLRGWVSSWTLVPTVDIASMPRFGKRWAIVGRPYGTVSSPRYSRDKFFDRAPSHTESTLTLRLGVAPGDSRSRIAGRSCRLTPPADGPLQGAARNRAVALRYVEKGLAVPGHEIPWLSLPCLQ